MGFLTASLRGGYNSAEITNSLTNVLVEHCATEVHILPSLVFFFPRKDSTDSSLGEEEDINTFH